MPGVWSQFLLYTHAQILAFLMSRYVTFFLSVLQVCSDGLLLGSRSRGETQVSAACSVSHRIPRSVGRLRVKASSNSKGWWTLVMRTHVWNCALWDASASSLMILLCTVLLEFLYSFITFLQHSKVKGFFVEYRFICFESIYKGQWLCSPLNNRNTKTFTDVHVPPNNFLSFWQLQYFLQFFNVVKQCKL